MPIIQVITVELFDKRKIKLKYLNAFMNNYKNYKYLMCKK